jgi:hypothetical protein
MEMLPIPAPASIEDTDMELDPAFTEKQILEINLRTVLCGPGCIPMRDTDEMADMFKCSLSSVDDCVMTTWLPKEYISVMIVGTHHGENKVIICNTGDTYTLSMALKVHTLPPGVAIMCTCTLDKDGVFRTLIYDGYNLPAVKNQPGDPMSDDDTQERYMRLRAFIPHFFYTSQAANKTFHLQWVGFRASLYLDGGIDVGHPIGGLISLTEDPFKPTRAVRSITAKPVIQQLEWE